MSRVLIMEDRDDLREDLVNEIRRRLPFVRVEESDRIEVGLTLIRTAAHREMPFDAAVLDFKLNSDDASRDQQVDEHLCFEIRRLMHDCLVLHVTGHDRDPFVLDHEVRCHSGIREPRSRIIPKEKDYIDRTVTEIGSWLFAKPVHEILDSLFRVPRLHAAVGSRHTAVSASHLLARLEHWLLLHWSSLDPATQNRVLGHFDRNGERFFIRDSSAGEATA